jgi:hypothetical protein
MNTARILLQCLFLFCCFMAGLVQNVAAAEATDLTLRSAVDRIDASIQSVLTCGFWEYGGERGQFRIATGYGYGHSELYVQWIADPVEYPAKKEERRSNYLVMKTVGLEEFDNYESATDISTPVCKKVGKDYQIVFRTENHHEDPPVKSTVTITLYDEPGKYKLTEKPVLKPRKKKPK